MRGYLYTQPLGYGVGYQVPIVGPAPGAGLPFLDKQQGYFWQRLLSVVFTLTTSAVVANRYVTVEYDDGQSGVPFAVSGAPLTVPASIVQRFVGSFSRDVSEWAPGTDVFFPLPPLFLEGGTTVKVGVANMDAGDTLTNVRLVYDRFTTDPSEEPQSDG